MTWLLAGTLLPSMAISWFASLLIRRNAERLRLMDQPGHRKVHTVPTPLGGGIAMWLGLVVPFALGQLALWAIAASRNGNASFAWLRDVKFPQSIAPHLGGLEQESPHLWVLLAGGTVLMVLGLVDDMRRLDWRLRLSIETLVAVAVVAMGWRLTIFLDAPWLTAPLSVLWIVGLVNTFNMLDNMDGLSAGVAAIVAGMLAAVMLLSPGQPQLFVAGFLLVLVGSLLGFLWHNRPPARLFMGDAGAYMIGYSLAMATIVATFAGEGMPRHSILAPLCVLAVPLYDTISVVTIRLRQGRSPFEGDQNHFSHRLVALGMTKPQAVLTIYLATATTGLGAPLLYQVTFAGAMIILLLVACVLSLVAILESVGLRNQKR